MASEEIIVSLDPDTFEDPDEFVVSLDPATFEDPSPPLRIEDLGRRDCEPYSSSEMKNTQIKNCHPLIPRVAEYIAASPGRTMTEVLLVAFFIGMNLLWSLPDIYRLQRVRKRILVSAGNLDGPAKSRCRRVLDLFSLDLGTDDLVPFQTKLFEAHVSQVNRLGFLFGKGMLQKIRQLALMGGLVHSRHILAKDQAEMMEILKRFVRELNQWVEDLERKAASLESQAVRYQMLPVQTSWDEIEASATPVTQGYRVYE